jgi:hypothetical protein
MLLDIAAALTGALAAIRMTPRTRPSLAPTTTPAPALLAQDAP